MDIIATLTSEFDLKPWQVENTVNLIDEGNTIPFIARYRKEAHGSLDDQVLRELNDRLTYLRNLDKRREEILNSIEEQGPPPCSPNSKTCTARTSRSAAPAP